MTMSTIGYGDLVPTTPLSKIFTIVYSILTIGLFVAIASKLVIVLVSRKKEAHERKRKAHSHESEDWRRWRLVWFKFYLSATVLSPDHKPCSQYQSAYTILFLVYVVIISNSCPGKSWRD